MAGRGTAWLLAALLCGHAAADPTRHNCRAPDRPVIPDGGSASEKELVAAKKRLESYLASADKFLTCLRTFEESLGEKVEEIDGHALVTEYNDMVDEMYLAGDEFNIALRKFKASPQQ